MQLLVLGAVFAQVMAPLAERVAADFGPSERNRQFVHYAVPAMSGVQRLPDAYPADGQAGAPVRIVMA